MSDKPPSLPLTNVSRRQLLRSTTALGLTTTLPLTTTASETAGSPDLAKFVQSLPRPDVRDPDETRNGAAYYDIPIHEFERQVHPDLPPTTLWGFDATVPGPVIKARRHEHIKLRFNNTPLPSDHLFEIDDRIHGTSTEDYHDYDGAVPDVRTVVHQHGLNVARESDGQADMWKSPNGVTGPGFTQHVHDIPNRQSRTTTSYHDHALGISRLNNYAGLHGFYTIESQHEDRLNLPRGEYDVPIMLEDKTFTEDGSLYYPDEFVPNFAGDTAFVNGAVWPYMEVEPRRYRFRFVNQSNGRTFSLALQPENHGAHDEHDSEADAPLMYQFAPDHGFLEDVVSIGDHGELDALTIAPFERAEVIIDFSDHAGETFTVTNHAAFPYSGGKHTGGGHGDHGGSNNTDTHLGEILQFRVTDPRSPVDDESTHPLALNLPNDPGPSPQAARETRHMTMGMRMENGLPTHVLNGKTHYDPGVSATPQRGTTEIWELENNTMHTHPIHMHLVDFRVIGRGPDGNEPPLPNERGPKDTVRVNPGETVRLAAQFGDFTGKYPWHCHILEHEEQAMMRKFEVVEGNADKNADSNAHSSGRGKNKGRENSPNHDDGSSFMFGK